MNILRRSLLFTLIAIIGFVHTGDAKVISRNSLNSDISNISDDRVSKSNLEYKTVSTTVGGMGGTLMPTVDVYKHLAYQGADNTLVVMLNIDGDMDADPVMLPDRIVNEALINANDANVKTKMIKLHLGVNYADNYNRRNYNPDPDAFFQNWKNICLHYAKICDDNNIPILCIGCEQAKQTVDANYNYWAEIVSEIRSKYPKLLLTYAAHNEEYKVDTPLKFWDLFDFIGFNAYFHYTNKLVSENPTLEEMEDSYYEPIFNEKSMMDIINIHAKTFNKKIFITETGLMPKERGLISPYDPENADGPTTYDGTALAIKAVFEGLCQNDNILGIAWWHVDTPFDYFNDNEVTSAEKTMHDCLKSGI